MVCPTDYIEPLINSRFDGQKYFYTSLGNTLSVDDITLSQIAEVITKNNIDEIMFILSEDNSIIMDALNNQAYSTIKGLKESYLYIQEHSNSIQKLWNSYNPNNILLSYYLNFKIRELKIALRHNLKTQIDIDARVYSASYDIFQKINPSLICIPESKLN